MTWSFINAIEEVIVPISLFSTTFLQIFFLTASVLIFFLSMLWCTFEITGLSDYCYHTSHFLNDIHASKLPDVKFQL